MTLRADATPWTQLSVPRSTCPCGPEIDNIWAQIRSIGEINFDALIAASEQAMDIWSNSRDCTFCLIYKKDSLFEIYRKLLDFFESAIITYTSKDISDGSAIEIFGLRSGQSRDLPQPHHDHGLTANIIPTSVSTVCKHSRMSLGSYELDEHQSRQLALELIFRKLKDIGTAIHQMRHQESEEPHDKEKIESGDFSRVMRLLGRIDIGRLHIA